MHMPKKHFPKKIMSLQFSPDSTYSCFTMEIELLYVQTAHFFYTRICEDTSEKIKIIVTSNKKTLSYSSKTESSIVKHCQALHTFLTTSTRFPHTLIPVSQARRCSADNCIQLKFKHSALKISKCLHGFSTMKKSTRHVLISSISQQILRIKYYNIYLPLFLRMVRGVQIIVTWEIYLHF